MGVGCENFLKAMNIKGPLPMYVGKFYLSIIFIWGGEQMEHLHQCFFKEFLFIPKLVIIDKNM
jgi:hypothetical protein